jgi:hypothetical protein
LVDSFADSFAQLGTYDLVFQVIENRRALVLESLGNIGGLLGLSSEIIRFRGGLKGDDHARYGITPAKFS